MRRGAQQYGNHRLTSPFLHHSMLSASLSSSSPILVQLWLDSISHTSPQSTREGEGAAAASPASAVSSPLANLTVSGDVQASESRWRSPQQPSAATALHSAHRAAMSPLTLSALPHPSVASSRSPSPLALSSGSRTPAASGLSVRAMWRSMSAQHAEEVESLLSRLRDAAAGSSLHAWLRSRLRLTEMAFASSRQRIILSTASRMHNTARQAALRRLVQRWRAVTASQLQAQRRADMWAERRWQRVAARDRRQAVKHWQQVTFNSRCGAAIAQSRRQRLLRGCLLHWCQRLSQQLVTQRAAQVFARAHREREMERLLLQWLRVARQRRRERHQQLALLECSRRHRLKALRCALAAWRQGSEWQRLCRRKVLQAMQRVAAQGDCSVAAALLFTQRDAQPEGSTTAVTADVRYRMVAYDFRRR